MPQVRKDKLLYFLKQEDAHGGQKPIFSIPLPTVSRLNWLMKVIDLINATFLFTGDQYNRV